MGYWKDQLLGLVEDGVGYDEATRILSRRSQTENHDERITSAAQALMEQDVPVVVARKYPGPNGRRIVRASRVTAIVGDFIHLSNGMVFRRDMVADIHERTA